MSVVVAFGTLFAFAQPPSTKISPAEPVTYTSCVRPTCILSGRPSTCMYLPLSAAGKSSHVPGVITLLLTVVAVFTPIVQSLGKTCTPLAYVRLKLPLLRMLTWFAAVPSSSCGAPNHAFPPVPPCTNST